MDPLDSVDLDAVFTGPVVVVEQPAEPTGPVPPDSTALVAKLESNLKPAPPKYVDEIHNQFLESITDRQRLIDSLVRETSPKAQQLLEALTNPKNINKKLSRIVRQIDMDVLDVEKILRSASMSNMMHVYIEASPAVAQDIIADCMSQRDICPRCEGLGKFRGTENAPYRACPRCSGTGEIRIPGNSDARKFYGNASGVIKAPSGPSVNINVGNASTSCVIDDLESLVPSGSSVIDITPG